MISLNERPMRSLRSDIRRETLRIKVRPDSSVLMGGPPSASGRSDKTITDAAHRLEEQRVGGIALDLATQAVDLHIHRALVDAVAAASQRAARDRLARRVGENAQHLALAVGEMDDLVTITQFAALEMVDVRPERHRLERRHR